MEIKVIKNIKDFENLNENWTDTLNQSKDKNVFQGYEINYSSFNFLLNKEKLFIIVFYNQSITQAIFPCYIDNKKSLRFINDIHFDFCGPIILENSNINKIFKNFSKFINSTKQINSINFKNLSSNFILDQLLFNFKYKRSVYVDVQHSVITNFKKWSNLNSSKKAEIKRIDKKYINSKSINSNSINISEITQLRNSMIKSNNRSKNFFDDKFINWINHLFKNNILEIKKFIFESKTLALSFHLKSDNYRIIWIDLYISKKAINIAHYIKFIQKSKENKISFGRGTYAYKMKNFDPVPINLYNFIYHKSFFSFFFHKIKKFLKEIIKYLIKY